MHGSQQADQTPKGWRRLQGQKSRLTKKQIEAKWDEVELLQAQGRRASAKRLANRIYYSYYNQDPEQAYRKYKEELDRQGEIEVTTIQGHKIKL